MLVFSILSYRKKILLTVSRRVRCLECFRKARLSSHAKKKETAVKDVTLYYYNRQKFFRLIGLACASQFVFWSWMAYFQFSKLHFVDLLNRESKKTQEKILDVSSKPGVMWKIVRYIEDWCYQFSPSLVFNMVFVLFIQDQPLVLACFAVAVGLFFTTSGWIYSLRSVNRLVLQGNNVRVVTHTPLGGTRSVTVPVSDVSCSGSRIGTKPQVTLKLKGHTFFFLVDKEGEFLQPTLFDRTVGVKRF